MLVSIVKCAILFQYCSAFKILLVFPIPYRSHAILGESFVRHLLKAGHEVTYITPYLIPQDHRNLNQIELQTKGYLDKAVTIENVLKEEINNAELFNVLMKLANLTLLNENVVKLLNDKNIQFDVAVIERMFLDVYCGFSAVFNCPYVSFFPYHDDLNIFEVMHETPNPAYTANIGTGNIPPFSFYQRVQELFFHMIYKTMKAYYITPKEEEFYNIMFKPFTNRRGRDLPKYDDVKHNASLALSTSHSSIGNSYLQPFSLVLIGGFHIDNVLDPLPKGLKKIMDSSNGVILFSTGSQLTSEGMPKEMKTHIMRVFSNLNYTVLWKATMQEESLPENVNIASWLPQQSILGHPKCVLFITHGGILSVTEAVHFGVPIIGIPMFGDQFVNIRTAVKNGIGKEVKLSINLSDTLEKTINEVLSNPRYRERAKEMSRIYHSRMVPPGVELVHWIEEVVTSRGAPHLRSRALSMPLYQKYYLDFIATILVLLIALVYILRTMFNIIVSKSSQMKKRTLKKTK
ncbi:UDP-glucosyltransferase 2-like [Pieris napi]|uniref:UDP-glucosyltransferase 2-like n=1 Tax=Pieris napi TaxID=78633 RepID=UPI001FBB3656|nr:UDP-glucosyltransferase 2-like [Pieris napi]